MRWLLSEDGFQIFESSVLVIGGITIALFIGAVVLSIAAHEYTRVENEMIGSVVESNGSLERFY